MSARYYRLDGLMSPGRVNVWLGGRFQTVNIEDLDDAQMKELFENGCPYVKRTPQFYTEVQGMKSINVQPTVQQTPAPTKKHPQHEQGPKKANSRKKKKH